MLGTPLLTVLLVAGAFLGAACGNASGFATDQPTQGKFGRLEAGELDALPVPGGAEPFGAPSQRNRAVTQSFKVTGLAPADVLNYYTGALRDQGWVASTSPTAVGDVWRGQWARNDRLLQVTAEPDADDGPSAPTSQLDLELSAA
jgi:predicted small secreted protein